MPWMAAPVFAYQLDIGQVDRVADSDLGDGHVYTRLPFSRLDVPVLTHL